MKTLQKLQALCIALAACALFPRLQAATTSRPFTVRDSIEMRVFTDPYTRTSGASAKQSPDGQGFVVVTTQGHIASNALESCLWYFSLRTVEDYLEGRRENTPPPRLLFRKSGVPQAKQFNSYGSLITNVQWSADSKTVEFLVEESGGRHHVYQTTISTRVTADVTPGEPGDVTDPSTSAGTTAYLVAAPASAPKHPTDTVSAVLTGKSIFGILFPDEFPDAPGIGAAWKIKVRYRGKTSTYPTTPKEFFPYSAANIVHPSVAPDGSAILTVVPVTEVPAEWKAYWAPTVARRFIPSTASTDRSGRDLYWPWQYAIIDLATGKTHPLFNAPSGYTTSSGSVYQAVWSSSGAHISATFTYFPIAPSSYLAANSVRPCAIAEYTVDSHDSVCLALLTDPGEGEVLTSVRYDSSEDVIAHWTVHGTEVVRKYDRNTRRWVPIPIRSSEEEALKLYIHQEIDTPPSLWVKKASQERQLWSPNPQLQSVELGKASRYVWTDSSGYQWHGGLVLPPGPKPQHGYPLVVQTHGFYNEHEFLVDGAFTTGFAAQPLACAGIAVLQMEDRPDKHTRPPSEEANDEVRGIEAALDSLIKDQVIDPSRVGIIGFSRTHWYVEEALEHAPERYRAAKLIDGVDMSYMQDLLIVPGYLSRRTGPESANGAMPYGAGLEKWIQHAPGFKLDKITAPIMLEAIDGFSVLGEWETYSILTQQGKPVDFIEIPHGQHILRKPKERYVSQQGTVDWFRFWLQGYEKTDLSLRPMYERWHSLETPEKTPAQPNKKSS